MLDIAASYHYIQFQGQLTNQTQENGKKTNFGPDLGSFDPNLIRTLENGKKRHFGLLGPNSGTHTKKIFEKT